MYAIRSYYAPLAGIPKLVLAEAGNFPEIAAFYYEEVISRGRGLMKKVLSRGVERGEFAPLDLDYAWRVVMAPVLLGILWKHTFSPYESQPFDFQRHLKSHLDLLFDGLGPRAEVSRQHSQPQKETT